MISGLAEFRRSGGTSGVGVCSQLALDGDDGLVDPTGPGVAMDGRWTWLQEGMGS